MLGEIGTAYERASGQSVRLSFAANGAVARQVQAGVRADVVVLADEAWMDKLQTADASLSKRASTCCATF